MAIMFPPGLREFIEVWVGANVATGNEDLGFDSRNPYKRLADDIGDLSDAMKGAISSAGNSLPPRIADEFVAAVKLFVDDNGQNHLQKFADEVREIGAQQIDRSIKLSEAKYQILIEFILMNIELALIAALAVFTGGTSLTEIAIAKARTALTILLILQRLGNAVPTPLSVLLEAIQEAFVSFAAQLISMTAPDDPDRRRNHFDWTDIGQAAVAGAFAGLFGGLFSQFSGPIVRNIFKNNRTWKEFFDLPLTFLNEGQAETFAEAFTGLIFLGTFTLNPGTFLSAGLSGLVFEAASTGAEYGGKWAHDQFFRDLDLDSDDINDLPGGGGSGGRDRYESPYRDTYQDTYRDSYGDLYGGVHGNGADDFTANLDHTAELPPPTRTFSTSDSYDSSYAPSPYSPGTLDDNASVFGDSDTDSVHSDTDSVFTDVSGVSSVSSLSTVPLPEPPGTTGAPGTLGGAAKPSSALTTNPSTNPHTNPYTNPDADPYTNPHTAPDALGNSSTGDADSVFSTLSPSTTGTPASTADTPSPPRPVRTESQESQGFPATRSPVDPAAVVPGEESPAPAAVDGSPLSSGAPAGNPVGTPSEPGSPDSIDMIMDWEDGDSDAGLEGSPEPSPQATSDFGRELLSGLFGPDIDSHRIYPALRDTLTQLDQLRLADPALRDAPLDLDSLTRRVLLLDPSAPVTDGQRSELFRVAMDPAVAPAGSLAELAAFHLELRGVLSAGQALTGDDGALLGRNWTTADIPGLDLTDVGKVVRQGDGGLARGDVGTAPWHRPGEPPPYVVMAEGDHERIVVRGYDGAPRPVPIDVFAELLARDPALAGLPPGTPVVLL
ncbi:lonely Cys domain-containing protein, partial [Streptomyces sp. NPDC003832]